MSIPSKPTQSSPLPGDDRHVVAAGTAGAEVSFEDQIQDFWKKNSRFILLLVIIGLAVIIGREVVQYMWKERERDISEAYGASDSSERLKAFAAEHEEHALAGFALLRVADEAYTASNYTEAAANYEKAVAPLKDSPLAVRARIGAAISQALGGDRAKGEAALKALADDLAIMAGQRSEARYHLATLAIGDGRLDEARKALDEVVQTDLTGSWAQRAFMLRSSLPSETVSPEAAAPATGEIPELKLNLPGSNP
ncbi:MAG TPA: tetratricopeptide repeat protein [Opitutaceae bacterium]|nr:tetratricopeptide repeat protein [Opitutaceae bacterium]